MSKANPGNYFEDFHSGQVLRHATPRTLTTGDAALYLALTGSRFVLNCADPFARQCGLLHAPLDDWLVFHIVFGKSVPDVSVNALANLGYAEGRFGVPVFPGDTLSARSTVIGLRENSNRQTGIVAVRTIGVNQRQEMVLDYQRQVMVKKKDPASPPPQPGLPEQAPFVPADQLQVPTGMSFAAFDGALSGSHYFWQDYQAGERIDHVDGMTIEESDHMLAAKLYQNNAKVHFNQHSEGQGRFGRRLIYGGHIISLTRALSWNGLGNAVKLAALNSGRHLAPTFAGDTIYAWSRIAASWELPDRRDLGALRIQSFACKNHPCTDFPGGDGEPHPQLVLEIDYTVLMPRRL